MAVVSKNNQIIDSVIRFTAVMVLYCIHSCVAWAFIACKLFFVVVLCVIPFFWPILAILVYGFRREKSEDETEKAKEVSSKHGTLKTANGCTLNFWTRGNGEKLALVCTSANGAIEDAWISSLCESAAPAKIEPDDLDLSPDVCDTLTEDTVKTSLPGGGDDGLDSEFTVVNFEWRGKTPASDGTETALANETSVVQLAADALDVLKFFKVDSYECVVGVSIGCQVALELACSNPSKVKKLLLLNGSSGHFLQSAFQPFFLIRLSLVGFLLNEICWLFRHCLLPDPDSFYCLAQAWNYFGTFVKYLVMKPLSFLRYRQVTQDWEKWWSTVFPQNGNWNATANRLNHLQIADAHSVVHRLHLLTTPTLLVCGLLDVVCPPYIQYDMAARLPNVRLVSFLEGTAFCSDEYTTKVGEVVSRWCSYPWGSFQNIYPSLVTLAV